MSTPGQTAVLTKTDQPLDVEREIRFAVVMYGGVSLAIYINGVAQELLHMVRATARSASGADAMLFPGKELSASEIIYREIAQYLDQQAGLELKDDLTRTRFVVDILSGTSAGGINGVFLAKALARNQTMNGLKSLWLTEGDLGKLLNDTKAEDYSRESGFAVQKPEKSLLNSQRMYRKLLEALAQMNEKGPADELSAEQQPSPLVDELDLFVTTTDIEGIPLPIKLADGVVYERRYRNVFHFRYSPDPRPPEDRTDDKDYRRDDFRKKDDPFLAFAARCTSSFPFAFDAMQLDDVKTILDRYQRYEHDDPAEKDQWDGFIKDYLRLGLIDIDSKARGHAPSGISGTVEEATAQLRKAFRNRSFGDGGYLDNKPFSYATSMLMRRSADCVIDRKLLYIEPTPEHPELAPKEPGPRPDFAENVRAAVLDLPREETIREDIARIDERNEILERVGSFAQYVDEDASHVSLPQALDHSEFVAADLIDMMELYRYGASYGAYHRLKVHEITELLTCLVTRALGHDPASDAGDAIRELVSMWRKDKYKLTNPLGTRTNGKPQKTENEFLVQYDIHYRLRRLSFASRRINQLAGAGKRDRLDSTAKNLLRAWLDRVSKPNVAPKAPTGPSDHPKKIASKAAKEKKRPIVDPNKLKAVRDWLARNENSPDLIKTNDIADPKKWLSDFREELNSIKKGEIAKPTQKARFTEEQFLNPKSGASISLRTEIDQLKLPWKDIEPILSENIEIKQSAIANLMKDGVLGRLDSVAEKLCAIFDNQSSSGLTIAGPEHTDPTKGADAARLCLDHYYENFLLYDLITYPVQYGTNAGEANVVHVYRVSPEDAPAIMEEKAGGSRDKLAGRMLMSFGAFLDESWRKNDMLWGRLDGAERLISVSLLNQAPDSVREKFISRAHLGILREEILQGNGDAVCRLLSNALAHPHTLPNQDDHVNELVQNLLKDKELAPYITEQRRGYLVTPQKFDRDLEPETALKYISRSATITGKMLDGLAANHDSATGKRAAGWITRLGIAFWSMIAVSVPQSLGNIFFRHWLGLLYLFSAVVILAGIVFQSVSALGWQLLGGTVSLHLVSTLVGDFITGDKRWWTIVRRVLIVLVATLIGFGTYFIATNTLEFLTARNRTLGIVAAIAVAALLGFREWLVWLKSFLRAPTVSFSYRTLAWLTLATVALVIALRLIGPKNMAGLEFARTADEADRFIAQTKGVTQIRFQLGVDFLLIVAYAAMLASYCVAGAKLFWQRRETLAQKFNQERKAKLAKSNEEKHNAATDQKDSTDKPSWRLSFFDALVVTGFAVAGLQWVAAIANATENVGLLFYLKEDSYPSGLEVAYWSAALKFSLIALGVIYAIGGFLFGAWKKFGARATPPKP